jgi:hypothetical protein
MHDDGTIAGNLTQSFVQAADRYVERLRNVTGLPLILRTYIE